MVATDIDVHETEAMMIIYALKPALIVGQDYDPFFTYLFPDADNEMDFPDLDERPDVLTHSSDLDGWVSRMDINTPSFVDSSLSYPPQITRVLYQIIYFRMV